MDPTIVLFAIEAGVKLGKKVNEVLLDKTRERPLLLPVGNLFGSIKIADAVEFFDRSENHHLVEPGGPYYQLSDEDKIKAYKTIKGINQHLGNMETMSDEAVEIVANLNKFEQYQEGFGSKPVVQRLLGTFVEIGIDYAVAHPGVLIGDSATRQYIQAFISSLDETDFAEGNLDLIASDMLVAGVKVFHEDLSLVTSDKRLEALLGGITGALLDDYKNAPTLAAQDLRRDFFKRVSASILRGAVEAFGENAEIFIQGDRASQKIIRSTMIQILESLKDKEELFSNDSLEMLVKTVFHAISENVALMTDNTLLQNTIEKILSTLSASDERIFSESTIAVILRHAIETLGENIETLIDPTDPQRQLMAEAVAAIAAGLSSSLSGGKIQELFSTHQGIELVKIVFKEVAENPEHLLGTSRNDPGKTALAQIIASVSKALGDDPAKIINGEGALEILRDALHVAVLNADKLLDLTTDDPGTNILYQILKELFATVIQAEDPRRLFTRNVLKETVRRVMSTVSANLDLILAGRTELIGKVVKTVLELANGALENRINGETIPIVIERLLRDVLLEELDIENNNAVLEAANKALQHSPT
ncbi:MAG: hypothetical protein GY801_06345 [bacterium]|nr:hypothetical protein [bacterium]